MEAVLSRKPVRDFLKERETYLPRKKLVTMIDENTRFAEPLALPTGINPEQAIEVVAGGTWAQGIAEGVCGPGYAGFPRDTSEFKSCVFNVSHRVAARTLGLTWTPTPAPSRRRK